MAKILIVDDQPTDRLYLTTLLGYESHALWEAPSAERALEIVRAEQPDLVICDLLLPGMDGFEFLKVLRAEPKVAATPVIFYSATYDDREAHALAASAGIAKLLPKASDPEILLNAVHEVLAEPPAFPAASAPPLTQDFDRSHLQLVNQKLFEKTQVLEDTNRQLMQEIADRRKAEEEVRREREWLRVTLESIGDAVIATDREGRILFMNSVAGKMTGWPPAEAARQTLESVFHIVNEHTRAPAENPLEKVLRLGVVQGLANHTLLISRDGTERPIEDCAAPIRDARGEMQGAVLVFHDATEARELEHQLRARAEHLAEEDRRKTEFLAILAHELRNPLAPISNALQVWPMVETDPVQMDDLRKLMQRQVEHLVRLIDDLLDVSRIARGKIELRRQRVELATILESALETVQPLIEAGGHQLTVALPAETIVVEGDVVRLVQVFGNLLNNAAKFTARSGSIWLSGGIEHDQAVVRVRDTGPGIPDEMLTRIFEPFVQVDSTIRRANGGLGIGLSLAKLLVEMHGGRIEVHSEGPGRGSEFLVRLPAVGLKAAGDATPPAVRTRIGLGRHRILVVDDIPASARTLSLMLKAIGQDVEMANDGASALEKARTQTPDVIFLDIAMPGMDGYEVARELRRRPETRDVVLVALTGYGQDEDRRQAFDAGFNHHMVKPASLERIEQLLKTVPSHG